MFRQMRRVKQQMTDAACIALLETAKRGVLSVQGDDGYPYGMPMDYVYDQGKIYFHGALEGHRMDAITSDDRVSFCVLSEGRQEPDEWWLHFDSVIVFGRIRVASDPDEKQKGLRMLGTKYFPNQAMVEEDLVQNGPRAACMVLTVEHMTGKHVRER